jgi:hypothetical protein
MAQNTGDFDGPVPRILHTNPDAADEDSAPDNQQRYDNVFCSLHEINVDGVSFIIHSMALKKIPWFADLLNLTPRFEHNRRFCIGVKNPHPYRQMFHFAYFSEMEFNLDEICDKTLPNPSTSEEEQSGLDDEVLKFALATIETYILARKMRYEPLQNFTIDRRRYFLRTCKPQAEMFDLVLPAGASQLLDMFLQSIAVDMQIPGLEAWAEAHPEIVDCFRSRNRMPLYLAAAVRYCRSTAPEFVVDKCRWHVHLMASVAPEAEIVPIEKLMFALRL